MGYKTGKEGIVLLVPPSQHNITSQLLYENNIQGTKRKKGGRKTLLDVDRI
jgi:hypothetical protein